MTPGKRSIFIAGVFSCLVVFAAHPAEGRGSGLTVNQGQGKSNIGIGGYFSLKGCGALLTVTKGKIEHMIMLREDFYHVLNGSHSPGTVAEYYMNFTIGEWQTAGGLGLRLYAGTGVMGGRGHDHGDNTGHFGGLAGDFGLAFHFESSVAIKIGISGCIGGFIDSSGNSAKLTLYENGLRRLPYPSIELVYNFK